MQGAGGYILVLDEGRSEVFRESIDELRFAEPVPEFSHSRHRPLVCFVEGVPGVITHLARGRRGYAAGTGLRRLNLTDIHTLEKPISVKDIAGSVSGRVRAPLEDRLMYGGLVPPKSFEALTEAAIRLAPETARILGRFTEGRQRRISAIPSRARESLAQQKEAVATALTMAGVDRAQLEGWDVTSGTTPDSYLDGLPQARLREDQMLAHDLHSLPGYEAVKNLPHPAVVFQNRDSVLTVLLANRLPLEEQLGVDLIYFNESFQSFVMVQYKAMERSTGVGGEWLFRLPDAQFASEIARMDSVLDGMAVLTGAAGADSYRLCENPFFLKLCPRIVFEPDNIGLVPGMYLPLDYWKLLAIDDKTLGPKGGRAVGYENARRHFNNTSFVSLVAGGWLGTTQSQSAVLESVIRDSLESGKAIVLAIRQDKDTPEDTLDDVEEAWLL